VISTGHRRRLNRALHELRRPLQALVLLDGEEAEGASALPTRRGLLELATSALQEIDRELNGGQPLREHREVSCRELVLASLERWRPAAPAHALRVFWDAGSAPVEGDPVAMARALDNLLANALEHGGPPVVVTGAEVAGRLRITIANGRADIARPTPAVRPARAEGEDAQRGFADPRRGHGLDVVSSVAAEHRGRFAICRTDAGCVAALELPLAQAEVVAGAA
jgi:two-component system, OmpR family, osmolarity sensor histidine kinase EnvZ